MGRLFSPTAIGVPIPGSLPGYSLYIDENGNLAERFDAQNVGDVQAWYKFGIENLTLATPVSTQVNNWKDASQLQRPAVAPGAGTNPVLNPDQTVSFDGILNRLVASFPLIQPATIYILARQNTWVLFDGIFDAGFGAPFLSYLEQSRVGLNTPPYISLYAGNYSITTDQFTIGAFHRACCIFDGVNSLLQVDDNAPITGDAGTGDPNGITIAAAQDGTRAADVTYKEMIIYAGAHNTAQRAAVMAYLATIP